jgi:RNA polymerase sigma-70 factor, ECF subfamily
MSEAERMDAAAEAWENNRTDLLRFVSRLVMRPEIAEEIIQETGQRAITAANIPIERTGARKWLFRVAANLAIDELRRQGVWGVHALLDSRADGESDESFVAASLEMRATAEVAAIARQHLAFCFSCTLRSLAPQRAAALLLAQVYGFTVKETADILNASTVQAKNWLQEARAALDDRYADTCALINKKGVCYQCSELSTFFNGRAENPLEGSDGTTDDRVRIVQATDNQDLSKWHSLLVRIIEQRAGKREKLRKGASE